MSRLIALLLFAAIVLPAAARADDYGPARTVAQLRSQARRLLARQARASGADPKNLVVSEVVVAGNEALLSWDSGKQRGLMRLAFANDRWWDTYEAAASKDLKITPDLLAHMENSAHTAASAWRIEPSGAIVAPPRKLTAGYGMQFAFSANDAPAPVKLTQVYARPPTPAEFLPNHPLAPGWGSADAVCYFDLTVGGPSNVTFKPGTAVDVWFPFVLDDQLQYSMSFFSNDKPSGIIRATIFDNTLHFVLGEFTLAPGKPLMAEIDGDPKPSQ